MLEKSVADGYGVRRNVGGQQKLERLLEAVRVVAGVVAVGDQEDNLAAVAAAALEHFAGGVNGGVEIYIHGLTAGPHSWEARFPRAARCYLACLRRGPRTPREKFFLFS